MPTNTVSENVDVGPATVTFDGTELGETTGETTFTYEVETQEIETEESGLVEEIVTSDNATVEVPIIESDVTHLSTILPWATIVENTTEGTKKLQVGDAIGEKLSQYAKELIISPKLADDKSRDINIWKAYPIPGPLEFSYSREGTRVANVSFKMIKDDTQDEGAEVLTIGDPSVTAS